MPVDPPYAANLVLYDGVCGLCNHAVQFVLRHDTRDDFRFASLQSALASDLLVRSGMAENPSHAGSPESTIYVISGWRSGEQKISSRSDAVLTILKILGGKWRMLAGLLQLVPQTFRDAAYRLITANRYRMFGKFDTCPLPAPEQREKFLDV